MNELRCYAAGGWFTESQDNVQTKIENYLLSRNDVKVYRPRYDGVKLSANDFHDPKLREKVFKENLENIEKANFIVANLDGRDGFQDTGTCYEVGYAMAKGIPVIGYQDDVENGKLFSDFSSIIDNFSYICTGINELDSVLDNIKIPSIRINISYNYNEGNKVLFIAPDNKEEHIKNGNEIASILVECFNKDFKWVDKLSNNRISENINTIFDDIKFMVAVIDDRHPIVSWMMGQCYARNIPIISYTNYDYGINVMLLCSILQHVKGNESLKKLIQNIKRNGISSIETFDSSNLKAF